MYPTFDINYNSAYSTKIEFNTTINEKMKGREQRYPVWTYPKRIFTLSFNKSPQTRKQLEEFFVTVMGAAGKFYFKWEKEKGGNDETYLCNFDADTLEQTIYDYGFSETKLNLECIDENPVSEAGELNFYHKAEATFITEFYTVIDRVFTAQNEQKSYWDTPKKSWTLKFEKMIKTENCLKTFLLQKEEGFARLTGFGKKKEAVTEKHIM